MMYNAAFVGAAVLAALVLPDTGWSAVVFISLTGIYVLLGAWYWVKGSKVGFTPRA